MGKRSGARSQGFQVFPKPAANDAARGLLPHRSKGLESMCGDIWRQSAGFPVEVGPEGKEGLWDATAGGREAEVTAEEENGGEFKEQQAKTQIQMLHK